MDKYEQQRKDPNWIGHIEFMKKPTAAQDKKADKTLGIKQGSKLDKKLDKNIKKGKPRGKK